MAPPDDSYDLALAAASLRANAADLTALLTSLADQLADTLGTRLRVQRGGRRRRDATVSAVTVALGSDEFTAALDDGDVRCQVAHVSGGIRIRNEALDLQSWLVRLLDALRAEAAHSDRARAALEHIVIGGTS
ncbi:MAG: hypothetical protein ACP5PB_06625 [Acidimicrobiales bacterium]